MKENEIPFVGNKYEVILGPYIGFIGECVSYDLESNLPIILQDAKYNSCAVKIEEVQLIGSNNPSIPRQQQN